MRNQNILVLGSSKENKKIKGIKFKKVYASNASIINSKTYLKSNRNIKIISVTTLKSVTEDIPTKVNLTKIRPNEIVLRKGKIDTLPNINFKHKLRMFENNKQWNFQKTFFDYGFISLFLSEFFYGENFFKKINYMKDIILYKKKFLGVSTGFFSILLALKENPHDNIYVSGISMTNTKHFYKLIGKETKIITRYKVDSFMIGFLKKKYKKKLITSDKKFAQMYNINYITKKNNLK